jgi:hypothetical protein
MPWVQLVEQLSVREQITNQTTTIIIMIVTMVPTTTIITEVEGVEGNFLPVRVAGTVNTTTTEMAEEAMVETVVDGDEGGAMVDLMETSRIIITRTMKTTVAV